MATIREWLSESKFDWEEGVIIYQEAEEEWPGWSGGKHTTIITSDHPILDKVFYDGFGSPKCPRFIAKDRNNLYFPEQYDGSTCIVVVSMDIQDYLNGLETPYPGG